MSLLKKVQSGDPLRIPARTFNTFIDGDRPIVKKPVAVYIEKVYGDGGFSGLGIGT
jgi:hypothetical protein